MKKAAYFQMTGKLFFDMLNLDREDVKIINVSMSDLSPDTIRVLIEGDRFPIVEEGAQAQLIFPKMERLEDGSIVGDWDL